MQSVTNNLDVFFHVRFVLSMVVSLSIARLLSGMARFVQHPSHGRPDAVHFGWVLSLLVLVIQFWWWEFGLNKIQHWTFDLYVFIVLYATLLYFLCALLFPDDISEYSGYEDYFLSRRKWFFSLFALVQVFDLADTLIKGRAHLEMLGLEYILQAPVYVVLCVIAIFTRDRRYHIAFVIANLLYQSSFIARQFQTL
jgi:hypothetical protein